MDAAADAVWPIVGIGASAGGLEALQALLKKLSCKHMGLVVAQHLSPTHDSMLTEILGRSTTLEVVTAADGMEVHQRRIHVLPSGADISVEGGRLRLVASHGLGSRLPIDGFFDSLANDRGPLAIGVVLSGGGSDGTEGLRAIKAHGGLTIAQDPSSAAHPSMPRSAIDAEVADFVLEPAAIAEQLVRIDTRFDPARARAGNEPPALTEVLDLLNARFGVDFGQYKPVTIGRRVERRMLLNGISDLGSYLRLVRREPSELEAMYRDLLINVTSFFREPEVFERLATEVLPRLLARRPAAAPIRVWVAGCSTGEEAYSFAMLLLETLGSTDSSRRLQVFATDVDPMALAAARLGFYPREIENHVSAERLERFFLRSEGGYRVSSALRDIVVFAAQNLAKDPPFSRIDLVSCRNVLIYMQQPLQRRLLALFHYALQPDGLLVLGASESAADAQDLFSQTDNRLKIFSKKTHGAVASFQLGAARGRGTQGPVTRPHARGSVAAPSALELADRVVLDTYGPAGLVVAADRSILEFRGGIAPYIAPAPGPATLHALKHVRPELFVELSAVLSQALDSGKAATSPEISIAVDGAKVRLVLDAFPLPGDSARAAVVLFREVGRAPADAAGASEPPSAGDARVRELEHTLAVNREYLRTTLEQADAVADERATEREELQAANEELQSTNEELQSSKEELQSTNEELATVNQELRNRMVELAETNDDLHNLLVAVDTPVVISNLDLRIRRFTAAAGRLFDLLPADVGRPIAHLKSFLDCSDLEALAGEVIRTEIAREREVHDRDHRAYAMRVLPYRGSDQVVRGAVLELRPSQV